MLRCKVAVCFLVMFLTTFAAAIAQDDEPKLEAVTAGDVKVDLGELRLRVQPLTTDELKVEADAWQGLLKESNSAVAEALIAKQGEDALLPLRQSRDAVIERMQAVVDELQLKGGKVDGYNTYIAASGNRIQMAADDPMAFMAQGKSWLTSPDGGIKLGIGLLKFLAILLVAWIVARIVANIVSKVLDRSGQKISNLLKDFIVNAVRRVIFLFGLVMALGALGVNVGPLLAGIGVLGFVIGFALQDTLANFASGFMILLNRPYDIGDLVEIDGQQGIVSSMTLVSTTINTLDNQKIVIPNGKIWGGTIKNITGNDTRRVDLMFGIDYGDDTDKAQQILKDVCDENDLILKSPAPDIAVHELGDSAVNILCRPWCKTSDYWNVHWYLQNTVKKRFDEAGLSFPFPQHDVHMHQSQG